MEKSFVSINSLVVSREADSVYRMISTLLQKHCNKKQETEEYILKLSGYIYHQGIYTLQADNEKGADFLPFTGVNPVCR